MSRYHNRGDALAVRVPMPRLPSRRERRAAERTYHYVPSDDPDREDRIRAHAARIEAAIERGECERGP